MFRRYEYRDLYYTYTMTTSDDGLFPFNRRVETPQRRAAGDSDANGSPIPIPIEVTKSAGYELENKAVHSDANTQRPNCSGLPHEQ